MSMFDGKMSLENGWMVLGDGKPSLINGQRNAHNWC